MRVAARDSEADEQTAPARVLPRVPLTVYAAASAFYGIFIARASFTLQGERAFGLFDDAMISLTYARNLATGHGLVWNIHGAPVEGITNLGWTLVMTIPELLRVPDRFAPLVIQLFGVAVLLGCGAVAARIAATLAPERRHAATIAGVLTLSCYPLVYWTLRGMEVGAITLLVLLLAASLLDGFGERSQLIASVAAVLGVIVRLDFVVFVGAAALWLIARKATAHRQLATRMSLATLAAIVAQELFRRLYYGAWLPNTYALKVGGVALGTRLHRGLDVVAYVVISSLAVALVLAVWAWRRTPNRRSQRGLLLLLAASAALYTAYVGGDAWEWMRYADRYLTPAVVLVLIVAATGIAHAAEVLPSLADMRSSIGAVLLATAISLSPLMPGGRHLFGLDSTAIDPAVLAIGGLLFVLVALMLTRTSRSLDPARVAVALTVATVVAVSGPAIAYWVESNAVYADFDASRARVGAFLRETTPADASLGVAAAGATIYFAHRDGVDILGKMDPRIARESVHPGWFFWPGHMKWDYAVTVQEHPSLIVSPWVAQPSDLLEIGDAGYSFWRIRPEAREQFGLDAGDDGGVFVAPGVRPDERDYAPAPFPRFARTMPLMR